MNFKYNFPSNIWEYQLGSVSNDGESSWEISFMVTVYIFTDEMRPIIAQLESYKDAWKVKISGFV